MNMFQLSNVYSDHSEQDCFIYLKVSKNVDLKYFEIIESEEKEEKGKRVKKAYMIYGMLSAETLKANRGYNDIFQVLKETNNCQPRLLRPAKLSWKWTDEHFPRQTKVEGVHHH